MQNHLRKIGRLKHSRELAVYKVENVYRICEDNGELMATTTEKEFVEIEGPIDELGIRQLKELLKRKNSRFKKPSEVVVDKTCSCGNFYKVIPDDCTKNNDGYWWNCDCRSTLFWPFNLIPKERSNGTPKDSKQEDSGEVPFSGIS